jgi:DNA-binding winged helix-turn-helix (wHTH) protein
MPADVYAFGPFELDPERRQLRHEGRPMAVPSRQFDLLHLLVARAGQVLSKDALVDAAWSGVAVTDNSVEQAISGLRRLLAVKGAAPLIETQARRGYRFAGDVRRIGRRATDDTLDALLAPHRAWIEGRAALETLERDEILRARAVFEQVLAQVPDQASAHVGLANAHVMAFEMTRSDARPDAASLETALRHAREACRLDAGYGEAWATLGFVLERTGMHTDALAASRRAVSLEPDNWRHHLRLAYSSWGEERLREADRALALLPGFPLAHWVAATVHVARQSLDEAERHLTAGLAAQDTAPPATARFSGVALHWLLGLLCLARGDERGADEQFTRELALESGGQLYARECCANVWYARGAMRLHRGDREGARAAFDEAIRRVPVHVMARVGLTALGADMLTATTASSADADRAGQVLALAGRDVLAGDASSAARQIDMVLRAAPPGSALWLLPLEPLLRVWSEPHAWASPLRSLRNRAA